MGNAVSLFRQSCQHCEDAPCIDVCPTGASCVMSRDRAVEKSQCIGCSYCIGACRYQVRYLNPSLKWQRTVISAETDLAKGFPPICVSAGPEDASSLVTKIAQNFRRGCRKINTINMSYLAPETASVSPVRSTFD
ncbi:4Fe-4S dicluster domain-containing protein [Shigella sonnei]